MDAVSSKFRSAGVRAWAAALVVAALTVLGSAASAQEGLNQPGDILIADQYNNRVIEVVPSTHQVVWRFGTGSTVPGPHSVVGTNDSNAWAASR